MPLHALPENELRNHCRVAIEALEYWLRRLIDETLTEAYGPGFLNAQNVHGDNVIKKSIREDIEMRFASAPGRYSRPIDAALLDEAIDIICNPILYRDHFRPALETAFPDGRDEARTFLKRLVVPRNHLAHANPISVRQAQQVLCYSYDVIDSLKTYYAQKNMAAQYNVPRIIRIMDSLGHTVHSSQIRRNMTGAGLVDFQNDPTAILHSGDKLSIEIEVDPSFAPEDYEVSWTHFNQNSALGSYQRNRLTIELQNEHVKNNFVVYCKVTSKRDWHRLGQCDDSVGIVYRILPPI